MHRNIDNSFPSSAESNSSPQEAVVRLPLTELHPFKGYPALQGIMPRNQPYLVRDDDPTMIQLVARVKERGVTYPGVVRPDPEGGYEIIAGQRRHRASELAGISDMPVIIREMDDEEAVTEMIDSNVNREDVLPSERAWAYETIVKAHEGDPDAIDTVLSHYVGYIRYCSKVHGKVSAEVEEHIKQKLIAALFKFRFDR